MSEHSFPNSDQVILSATVEVNGRKLQVNTPVNVRLWTERPEYQDQLKAETLRVLGEAIVKDLAPEVTVTMPAPTLSESLATALRPFDYPQEY